MRRPYRRLAVALGLAAGVFVASLDLVQHYGLFGPVALVLGAVVVGPLPLYRQPLVAWLAALASVVVTAVVTAPAATAEPWPMTVSSTGVLVVLAGLVGARGERRLNAVVLGALTAVGVGLLLFLGGGAWLTVLLAVALCAVAAVVGDVVHARRRAVTELTEERQVSAAERDRRRMVEERARIARELHDVVAHHMSMITVQAETARYRLDPLPEHVAEEFTGIATLARSSLTELRGLLSALRDETDAAELAPQPTLADLPALTARITEAGTPVTLTMSVDPAGLSQVVQLAVYRIVQEALSNVVRHAGPVRTTVAVTREDAVLRVEVTNEAPTGDRPAPEHAGHGLVGLRERAALLGGTFEVDRPDGGWRVRVELPL